MSSTKLLSFFVFLFFADLHPTPNSLFPPLPPQCSFCHPPHFPQESFPNYFHILSLCLHSIPPPSPSGFSPPFPPPSLISVFAIFPISLLTSLIPSPTPRICFLPPPPPSFSLRHSSQPSASSSSYFTRPPSLSSIPQRLSTREERRTNITTHREHRCFL